MTAVVARPKGEKAARASSAGRAISVLQRVVAAVFGGYALAVALSILVADTLPQKRFDAVMAAMLLSFVFYLAVILWVFTVRALRTMWLGLLASIALVAGAIWLLRWSGTS